MNLHDRKVKIIIGILIALIVVIAFRIVRNIQNEKERAERIAQSRNVAVETGYPKRQTIIPVMSFSGSLDPEWQADVAAKIDGRLEKLFVHEGDKVAKGQIMAILEKVDTDADLLNAKGTYLDAQATLKKAETDLRRYEKLYAAGAVSEQSLDDYRFARDNAAAQLESALGNLHSMESKSEATKLLSPADGIVAKRYYQEGYYATAGTAIFSVADINTLKITIHIPEGQVDGVAVGNKANIKLPAYPNKKIVGQITRIAPVADQPDHTFTAEISVDNSQGLLAGVYANVTLVAQPKKNALTIPVHAIVMRDDQQTVFVPDEEGVITRRVLEIGYSNDKIAEVLSGLGDNDMIVTEGHNKLREGSRIKLKETGKQE